jgi:tetratricopeptide (TPR) repeat protein
MRISRIIILAVFFFIMNRVSGQQAAAVDSMKIALGKAVTPEQKIYWLDNLSRTLMNVNLKESDQYGEQLIMVAEESRDRNLMVKAYMSNGVRCSYFAAVGDYTKRSIGYYEKALTIAKQNKMDTAIGAVLLRLSSVYLSVPDKEKALSYANEGSSLISTLKNDSLEAEANNIYGHVYLARNEKTMALRYYLNALRIAEETKQDIKKDELLRNCYLNLSNFYSQIEDYDKAIDYYVKALKKLEKSKQRNAPYQRAIDLNNIGKLYSNKDNHEIAISYYEKSLSIADSLKFSNLKIPAYVSLLNQYLRMKQPRKALDYFNSASGVGLKKFLNDFGFSGAVDQAYAEIYTDLNKLDSAKFYFDKATPFYDKNPNESMKIGYYGQLANFYQKNGDYKQSIDLYLKVKEMADRLGHLESSESAAKHLDSLYNKTGNYQLASQFNAIYYKYKDSIETLNKEKELAQVEAADEQQRQERIKKEEEETKKRRYNIQYMAITLGIVGLFLALVVLGMFKVSATTIKMLGFFAFLMFFEFIFLLFKKNIYSITKAEPWKDLIFMIGLAALLLPLHHWIEHRVIKYLTSHNRLTSAGHHIKNRLMRRRKEGDV